MVARCNEMSAKVALRSLRVQSSKFSLHAAWPKGTVVCFQADVSGSNYGLA